MLIESQIIEAHKEAHKLVKRGQAFRIEFAQPCKIEIKNNSGSKLETNTFIYHMTEIVTEDAHDLLCDLGYETVANTRRKEWYFEKNGLVLNRAWISEA